MQLQDIFTHNQQLLDNIQLQIFINNINNNNKYYSQQHINNLIKCNNHNNKYNHNNSNNNITNCEILFYLIINIL